VTSSVAVFEACFSYVLGNDAYDVYRSMELSSWLLVGLVTTFGRYTIPVSSGTLSLAIPLWVGAMSTGNGSGHYWGRNGEFCIVVCIVPGPLACCRY